MTRQKTSFLEFIYYFLWLLFPINKNKNQQQHLKVSWSNIFKLIVTDLFPSLILCFVTLIINMYSIHYLSKCFDEPYKVQMVMDNYWYLVFYCCVSVTILLSSFSLYGALMQSLVRLFTLNRYQFIEYNNFALLSVSIKEFWSKRYNYFVRTMLHQNVFTPLINNGYSKYFAAFMSFIMSGLMHVFMVWKQLNNGIYPILCTIYFFCLHGIITMIEAEMYGKRKRNQLSKTEIVIRIIITNFVFALTLPIYMGLFIEIMPELNKVHSDSKYHLDQIMSHLPTFECIYPT